MCSCGKMAAGKCNCGKDKSYDQGGRVNRKIRKALKKYGKGLDAMEKGNQKKADRMQSKGVKKAGKAGMSMRRLEDYKKSGYTSTGLKKRNR